MSCLQSLRTTSIAHELLCRFLSTAIQSRLISHLPLAQHWISYCGVPSRIRRSFCTRRLSEPSHTNLFASVGISLGSYLQAYSIRGGHDAVHLGREMLQNIHAAMMQGDLKMMVRISCCSSTVEATKSRPRCDGNSQITYIIINCTAEAASQQPISVV